MNILYLECNMGAAGDMLCASLFELCDDKDAFLEKMNSIGLENVNISAVPEEKCGILGTRIIVKVHGEEEGHEHHHHHHSSLGDVRKIIEGLNVPKPVKTNALEVYNLLAAAESRAHGKPVELVHFHEVGTLDAIADIVGFSLLVHMLGAEKIIASPVNTGSGKVHTSHGVLPVPAPATAHLLLGIPSYSDGTRGELCTPTGAALLKHFATEFGAVPNMVTEKIGYGMGKKDFEAANCVRTFLGSQSRKALLSDRIVELRCNIDDMTPEAIGFAMETLLEKGARDVYIQPILMKKNRPGFLMVCLSTKAEVNNFAKLILKYTTTLGVRKIECERYVLDRDIKEVKTTMGQIRIKHAQGYEVIKSKLEYEDVARFAKEKGVSFDKAYRAIISEVDNI